MTPYHQLGELLRTAREEQRLSVAEVAKRLHIRPRYLLALEAGDVSALPGQAYAVGYLKRYVSLLNLDTTEMMRRFELSQKESRAPFFFLPQTFSQAKQPSSFLALGSLLAAIILLGVWLMVFEAYHAAPSPVLPLPAVASPVLLRQSPCLSRYERLYPPCYDDEEPAQSILHLTHWPRFSWR